MTFLQRTLGKNYKWVYLIKYNLISGFAGLKANAYMMIGMIISTLAVVYLWKFNTDSTEIFTYLLVGRIYKSIVEGNFQVYFGADITDGKITKNLIMPTNFMNSTTVQFLGKRIIRNSIEIFGFGLGVILSVIFLNVNISLSTFQNFMICLAFIPISYFINYFTTYSLASIAFFLKDPREFVAVDLNWQSFKQVFYGLLIPLNKLPFANICIALPFAYCVHHPMQIYLGKYDNFQIVQTFLGGIVWCFVLWILARLVFKAGLKKNEAVGL